jgi:hypothetical protein
MASSFDRRDFLKEFSATCSMLGLRATGQSAQQAPDTVPRTIAHAGWVAIPPRFARMLWVFKPSSSAETQAAIE